MPLSISPRVRALAVAFVVSLGVLAGGQSAYAQSVLVLGALSSPAWNTEVAAKLTADGRFSSVTIINASTTTPSVATLQTYDAVLVFNDGSFANSSALGDNLHAYLLGGGGVVNAAFTSVSYPIEGAWQTNADYALIPGGFTSAQASLGTIALPAHPVVAGVTSFNGGTSSYRGAGTLSAASTGIANWSSGEGLAATKSVGSGIVVTLNFFPPSSTSQADFWVASTDGALLMANALKFVADSSTTPPAPVPTLTEWAMLLLVLALAGSGALVVSRRTA